MLKRFVTGLGGKGLSPGSQGTSSTSFPCCWGWRGHVPATAAPAARGWLWHTGILQPSLRKRDAGRTAGTRSIQTEGTGSCPRS